jgi:leucyl/phenylalanyl-tRNA--protein transferase
MPVFQLTDKLIFPRPDLAGEDGLLAIGGDLSEKRLLLAYSLGIFPWYSEGYPILWWSTDPRLILLPEELTVSRSLHRTLREHEFIVTMDTAFEEVIGHCASARRKNQPGTWITDEMREAYLRLHRSGYAHSVESWKDGKLAGGLYGISLGAVFFGESMFAIKSNASKAAFATLVRQLQEWDFKLIDCQMTTGHLLSFGAKEIARDEFMKRLGKGLEMPARKGVWKTEK